MFLRKLLLLTVLWHVLALSSLAAPDSPAPAGKGQSSLWDSIQNVVDEPEFYIPVAGGGGVVFVILIAAYGSGKFHVNQFRIYFQLKETAELTPTDLIRTLVNNFEECFTTTNPVAEAKLFGPNPPHVIFRFDCKLWLARKVGRFDDVELVSTGDTSFIAKTAGHKGTWLKQHFLSGVRSWCILEIQPCKENGNSKDGKIYFLETAAFERYTNVLYRVLVPRKHIQNCWIHFLCDALVVLEAMPVDYKMVNNQETSDFWKTAGSGRKVWVREVSYAKKELPLRKPDCKQILKTHPGIEKHYEQTLQSLEKANNSK